MTPRSTGAAAGLVAAALAVSAYAPPAAAVEVYINGVLVTGVRNQDFDNVTVSLDAQGNVRITAPHYRVERLDTEDRGPAGSKTTRTGPAAAPGTGGTKAPEARAGSGREPPPEGGGSGLGRRYWLVAESSAPGRVQYRIEVRVNGRLVRSFDDSDLPAPVEVTEYLRAGPNAVRITADKITEGGRRSTSSRDWLRIVLADGHVEGTSVVIDRPGVIFTRTAAQTDRDSREFTLTAE